MGSKMNSSKGHDAACRAFLSVRRFGSLDGLRCLSIVAVIWHHSGIHLASPIFQRGQLGVHLFFAISGFLITSLMIRERTCHGQIALGKFFIRRSLRIFPLYYAALLAYVLLVSVMERGTAEGRAFFANLPAYATYTSNWFVERSGDERVIFFFAWSLAVEEQFYLTWPWVERFATKSVKIGGLLALLVVVFANHLGWLRPLIPSESLAHRILWQIAPTILFGVIAAHCIHSRFGFVALNTVLGRSWSAPAAMLAVIGAAAVERQGQAWEYVVYLSLVALVIACTIREDNGLARILRFRPFVRMGTVSYGIYLMHMLGLNASARVATSVGVTNQWVIWIMGILFTYVAAELSFCTFERFFQNWKGKHARP
jgi:peptidoglycan/LPS O-acetylase OafA/YrhL